MPTFPRLLHGLMICQTRPLHTTYPTGLPSAPKIPAWAAEVWHLGDTSAAQNGHLRRLVPLC